MFHANNIPRPQLKFTEEIDNSNKLWIPKLIEKPNAIQLWDSHQMEQLQKALDSQSPDVQLKIAQVGYLHPYQYEISSLTYLQTQLQQVKEKIYLPLESTTLTWIDTLEELQTLVTTLNQEKELAIDLEVDIYTHSQHIESQL